MPDNFGKCFVCIIYFALITLLGKYYDPCFIDEKTKAQNWVKLGGLQFSRCLGFDGCLCDMMTLSVSLCLQSSVTFYPFVLSHLLPGGHTPTGVCLVTKTQAQPWCRMLLSSHNTHQEQWKPHNSGALTWEFVAVSILLFCSEFGGQ